MSVVVRADIPVDVGVTTDGITDSQAGFVTIFTKHFVHST
jgi:hypothetical protein